MSTFHICKEVIRMMASVGSGMVVASYATAITRGSSTLPRVLSFVGGIVMGAMVGDKVGEYVDTYAERILAKMEEEKK